MLKPGGYATWTGEDGTKEMDTFTCCHCNCIVFVQPLPAPPEGGFCRMCMKPVCTACADLGKCTPFEKKLEQAEARDRLRRRVAEW